MTATELRSSTPVPMRYRMFLAADGSTVLAPFCSECTAHRAHPASAYALTACADGDGVNCPNCGRWWSADTVRRFVLDAGSMSDTAVVRTSDGYTLYRVVDALTGSVWRGAMGDEWEDADIDRMRREGELRVVRS